METKFSAIELQMKKFERDTETRSLLQTSTPFAQKDMTDAKRAERRRRADANYWFFDRCYFPHDMYSDGYSKSSKFHKKLFQISNTPGVHVVAGPRKHGKTATFKKIETWRLLTGRTRFLGVGSQNLPVARAIMSDIAMLIRDNPRIMSDFNIAVIEDNNDVFSFYVPGIKGSRVINPFSEGRSIRSASSGFDRPQRVLYDDLETRITPIGGHHTKDRVRMLAESYQSMSDNGTLITLGNNFDKRGYIQYLLNEQEQGIINKNWHVHVFPAWDEKTNSPLWAERYNADSEAALKSMLKPLDHSEWSGDFMQKPVPSDGYVFNRPHHEYDELPDDALGVMFADPNLSLRSKGDTAAIVVLLYSPKNHEFYIPDLYCKSYSFSSDLLDDYFKLYQRYKKQLIRQGWDGNVNQESTWTNFVRNWCLINKIPFPTIEYCKYNVDLLSKNASTAWNEGRIKFRKGLSNTKEGEVFLDQVFSFISKKEKKKDDAPDVLISAYELIHERGLGKKHEDAASRYSIVTITDVYSF